MLAICLLIAPAVSMADKLCWARLALIQLRPSGLNIEATRVIFGVTCRCFSTRRLGFKRPRALLSA